MPDSFCRSLYVGLILGHVSARSSPPPASRRSMWVVLELGVSRLSLGSGPFRSNSARVAYVCCRALDSSTSAVIVSLV